MGNKALLVGINKYPDAPLAGCVNDVMDMAQYLVQAHGFKQEEIRLLVDTRATAKEILARLDWLTTNINPGDKVFFHYSGHGAQIATRNLAEEVDGLDEIICPVNFDWTEAHLIRDKQLNTLFKKIPAGAKFNWISDSCHSGDLSRNFGNRSRNYPVPEDIIWRNQIAHKKSIKASGLGNKNLNVGFISGCQSNQTSADTHFNGRANGAATYFILKALHARPQAPLTDIVKIVNGELIANHYSQRPQAEGLRVNQPFLG